MSRHRAVQRLAPEFFHRPRVLPLLQLRSHLACHRRRHQFRLCIFHPRHSDGTVRVVHPLSRPPRKRRRNSQWIECASATDSREHECQSVRGVAERTASPGDDVSGWLDCVQGGPCEQRGDEPLHRHVQRPQQHSRGERLALGGIPDRRRDRVLNHEPRRRVRWLPFARPRPAKRLREVVRATTVRVVIPRCLQRETR